jgi:hypothetical protein
VSKWFPSYFLRSKGFQLVVENLFRVVEQSSTKKSETIRNFIVYTKKSSARQDTILEIKGVYHIKRPKENLYFTRPESNEEKAKKGLSATYRKCELVMYFKVINWLEDISVTELSKGLQEEILFKGFLPIQSEDTYWSVFRLRSMSNILTRKQIVIMPLYGCSGKAPGTSKSDRAFVFNLYEKFARSSRKVHIRGVTEEIAGYGSKLEIQKDLELAVGSCEYLLSNPLVVGSKVTLLPGRVVSKRKEAGVYDVNPVLACYGGGIQSLPETNEAKKRKTNRSRRLSSL